MDDQFSYPPAPSPTLTRAGFKPLPGPPEQGDGRYEKDGPDTAMLINRPQVAASEFYGSNLTLPREAAKGCA